MRPRSDGHQCPRRHRRRPQSARPASREPATTRPGLQRSIVAGIDGFETALAAAQWASVFADALALPLHLVHSSPPACARPRSGVRRSARAEAGTLAKIITPYRREYPDFPVEERSLTKSSADRPGEEAESRNHGQLVTLWPTHSEIWPLLLRTYTDIWGEECVRELLKTLMCVEPAPGDRIIPTWLLPVPTRS